MLQFSWFNWEKPLKMSSDGCFPSGQQKPGNGGTGFCRNTAQGATGKQDWQSFIYKSCEAINIQHVFMAHDQDFISLIFIIRWSSMMRWERIGKKSEIMTQRQTFEMSTFLLQSSGIEKGNKKPPLDPLQAPKSTFSTPPGHQEGACRSHGC